MLRFEWDSEKSSANKSKHGVSFEEAQTAFFDDGALEYSDPDRSDGEDRFLLLGRSSKLRVLVVCYCLRVSPTTIRIISARKATTRERSHYARRGKT